MMKNPYLIVIRNEVQKYYPNIIIDCSHGNSQKDYRKQPLVIENICGQLEK